MPSPGGGPGEVAEVQDSESIGAGDGEREDAGRWEMVAGESEEQVLTELGIDYIEPEKRNFAFIVNSSLKVKGRPKAQTL